MRHLFYCDTVGRVGSVGLLLLRLVMGAAFLFHGWPKINHYPFDWMGPRARLGARDFAGLGGAGPEFGGRHGPDRRSADPAGLLGNCHEHDRGAGRGSTCRTGDPFVGKRGRAIYELAAVYLACGAVLFLALGTGRFFARRAVVGAGGSEGGQPSGVSLKLGCAEPRKYRRNGIISICCGEQCRRSVILSEAKDLGRVARPARFFAAVTRMTKEAFRNKN